MLKNIPKIISPELMKVMMEMGHSDVLIIADANYPAAAHAKRLIRLEGVEVPELLEAILPFFHWIILSNIRSGSCAICQLSPHLKYGMSMNVY